MDREQIENLLHGATLGRIGKQLLGASMIHLANNPIEELPGAGDDVFIRLHIEAQTWLLLRIQETLESIDNRLFRI